jgi:hypothetical protein
MNTRILAVCVVLIAGCTNKTETGYEPRKLGDSFTVQRGYYATPFSPESRAAEAERDIEFGNRRPGDWRPSPY